MTTPEPTHRNSLLRTLIPVAVIALLAVGGLMVVKSQTAPKGDSADHAEIKVGGTLPDFQIQQWGGKQAAASSLGKKLILVNFWATWCEACMIEMPSIQKLYESYKDKGFDVLAINVDENPDAVLPKTVKQLGITFPVYLDQDQKLAELFDVHAIPLTVIIDENRKILLIEAGEKNWNGTDIRSQIEQWLAG